MTAGRMVSIVVLCLGVTVVSIVLFDPPSQFADAPAGYYNNDNTMRYIGALFGRGM